VRYCSYGRARHVSRLYILFMLMCEKVALLYWIQRGRPALATTTVEKLSIVTKGGTAVVTRMKLFMMMVIVTVLQPTTTVEMKLRIGLE